MEQEFTVGPFHYTFEDGILYIVPSPNTTFTLELAQAAVAKQKEVFGDQKLPIFFDSANIKEVLKETRNYYSTGEGRNGTRALALFAVSPAARIMGNFFMRISKPPFPTQLFSSKEAAVAWLQQFKDQPHD